MRVALGYNTSKDKWDLCGVWTYYHNSSSDSKEGSETAGYYLIYSSNPQGISVKASYMLNYNMLNLELGKGFYLFEDVSLKPHFGAQGGWIYQTFKSHFVALHQRQGQNPFEGEGVLVGRNNYWGVGITGGIESNWHLTSNFNLFGNFSAALLYGELKMNQRTKEQVDLGAPMRDTFVLSAKEYDMVPHMQAMLGFSWGTCFNDEKMFFGLRVAGELNYWWDQYNLYMLLATEGGDNQDNGGGIIGSTVFKPLTLIGLTAGVKLEF